MLYGGSKIPPNLKEREGKLTSKNGRYEVSNVEERFDPLITLTEDQQQEIAEAMGRFSQIKQDLSSLEQAVALARRELELDERELRILTSEEQIVSGEVKKLLQNAGLDPDETYTMLSSGEVFLQKIATTE